MSEFLLDSSERRPSRAAAAPRGLRTLLRPLLISAACAAMLTGFAVAASSVMADLVSPVPKLAKGAAIGKGLASSWPDLKDGLPSRAGTPVTITGAKTDAPAAPPSRMASLPDPMSFAAGTPAAPSAALPPKPAARSAMSPAERIPVPTEVAVVASPPPTKIVMPGRTVAVVAPRASDIVRARDEVSPVQEAAKPREEATRAHEAAAEKPTIVHPAKPAKASVAAKPAAEPAKVAVAKPPAEPAKVAVTKPIAVKTAAVKPTGAVKPAVTHTAAAEPDSDETEILGVKLPSLAPAGRKIKDGVSALGDAVRNAF